ncbi:hypothetical protein [Microcoleus sp. T3_D1]|uniref:hypothetical protein n=1 Tax=Microcoleus sp. T3_D1 TaxID=3055427 RepID=UPI002FD2E215
MNQSFGHVVTDTATCTRYENFFGVHFAEGEGGDGKGENWAVSFSCNPPGVETPGVGQKSVETEMLHHSQLVFYEQAFRPVPQENLYFVEQAGKPVADNGARYQLKPTEEHHC